ncbi:hypothetical protein M3Y99_01774500 [Aphelenchoides fujianensis]|nr:hypothetical protein M3Y99_01774500 [Aphelenchoides fujianensis]
MEEYTSDPHKISPNGLHRQGEAVDRKAVQLASENHVFNEFPECSLLSTVDRVSIKLQNPQLHDLMKNWAADHRFDVIKFNVRNEAVGKQTILEAALESGRGVTVRNAQGKPLMVVRLSENDPTSPGETPAPRPRFSPFMIVEKVSVSLYQVAKAVGTLGTNCTYWIKAMDGTVIGYIRPKLTVSSNVLVVKFMSNNRDAQVRTTMLGVALLLMISECYPTLRSMLQESMHKEGGA